jgi:hypothetical protein
LKQNKEKNMELTVNDIAAAVQLIDIVTARGAIRGEELSQVGVLRDRFAAFVRAAQEQNVQASAEAGDEVSEETVDTAE